MVWKVECPKVSSATVAFVEAVKLNHELSSKVGSVLAKLLRTRLDGNCNALKFC